MFECGMPPIHVQELEEKLTRAEKNIERIDGLERKGKFITIKEKKQQLCRAKKVVDDSWVYGYSTLYERIPDDIRSVIVFLDRDKRFNCHEVYKTTVCDFTGMHDKKGTRIFEGDIVGCFCNTQIFVVKWCNVRGGYFFDNIITSGFGEPSPECLGNLTDTIEVLGNIYDNPELLEKIY